MERFLLGPNPLDSAIASLEAIYTQELERLNDLVAKEQFGAAKLQLDTLALLQRFASTVKTVAAGWPAVVRLEDPPAVAPEPVVEAEPAKQPEPPKPIAPEPVPVRASPKPEAKAPEPAKVAPKPETKVPEPVKEPPKPETKPPTTVKLPVSDDDQAILRQRKRREKLNADFISIQKRVASLASKERTPEIMARQKAELCRLRAWNLDATHAGMDRSCATEEIRILASQISPSGSPLAKEGKGFEAEDWRQYGDAFDCLAEAEIVADWIRKHPNNPQVPQIYNTLGSCCMLIYRFHSEKGMPFDTQQNEYYEWLDALVPEDKVVQSWVPRNQGGPKLDALQKEAARVQERFRESVLDRMLENDRAYSLAELADFVMQPYEGEDFVEALEEKIQKCLDSKVPPTNKDLWKVLLPVIDVLEPGEGARKKLYDHLHKQASLFAAKGIIPTIPSDTDDEVPDEEYAKMLDDLRPLLSGKRLLIVGGKKGQSQRGDAYRKTLGLAEVEWPDMEKTSNIKQLWAPMAKADIVVLLIKFCRHQYAQVIAEANKQGKMTAKFKAGLNVRRVVLDLHEQLVANQRNSA